MAAGEIGQDAHHSIAPHNRMGHVGAGDGADNCPAIGTDAIGRAAQCSLGDSQEGSHAPLPERRPIGPTSPCPPDHNLTIGRHAGPRSSHRVVVPGTLQCHQQAVFPPKGIIQTKGEPVVDVEVARDNSTIIRDSRHTSNRGAGRVLDGGQGPIPPATGVASATWQITSECESIAGQRRESRGGRVEQRDD